MYCEITEKYKISHFSKAKIMPGQHVLLRVDLNFSLKEGSINGVKEIVDFSRLDLVLPTIRELLTLRAKIVLLSHLGDPAVDCEAHHTKFSFSSCFAHLFSYFRTHLGCEIALLDTIVDAVNDAFIINLLSTLFQKTDIILLENLRFTPGETKNDPKFAQSLANLGTIYINDAFACSHRKHASIVGIPMLLPSYCGSGFLYELSALEKYVSPQSLASYVGKKIAIIGGKKISTKLPLISALTCVMDHVVVVGAMANTFLLAAGYNIGDSFSESDFVQHVIALQSKFDNAKIILPKDFVLSNKNKVTISHLHMKDMQKLHIYDIGEETITAIYDLLCAAEMVIWNGPAGYCEDHSFAHGTLCIASSISSLTKSNQLISVIGGGDTLSALSTTNVGKANFSHVSTGGGAFLEWLIHATLPGIIALQK